MSRQGRIRRGPNAARRKQQAEASRARAARRAKRAAKPRRAVPPPPRRAGATRPPAAPASAAPGVDQELARAGERIKQTYERLQERAALSDVYDEIGRISTMLNKLPSELDELRQRGYVHGGSLDDRLLDLDDQWDAVEPRVHDMVMTEQQTLGKEVTAARFVVARAGRSESGSAAASDRIDALEQKINTAKRNIENLYNDIHVALRDIKQQLHAADELLDWIEESSHIKLLEAEGPVTGAEAQWLRDADEDGPTGILILTDQRLLFEQREKIVTRRMLGIFARESEMRQELLLDIDESDIESVVADEKKGRFGFGKKEIVRLVGTADADFSRLAFLLKDADSDDWARMLKRVMTGDIDSDRDEAFVEAMEVAAEIAASFPTTCPSCLATLPEPQRGDTSISCEFCGSVVKPEEPAQSG